MNPTTNLSLALGIVLLSSVPALAQSNLPYHAGSVGISLGYRQAILNSRLLGSRPSALVRGPSGGLLDVERRGSQAFLQSSDSGAFLAGARPNSGWPTGLGTGLGWGHMSLAVGTVSYAPGTWGMNDTVTRWIAMLPAVDGQTYWGGLAADGGASPMDVWIRQL